MKDTLKARFQHCCGLQGFGRSLHDLCPECHFTRLVWDGVDEDEAEIRTKIAKEKSDMALFPRFKEHCKREIAKLEAQLKDKKNGTK